MRYQVINDKTNEVEAEFFTQDDAIECIDFEFSFHTHSIIEVIPCRGCSTTEHVEEHQDAHGISTGYWCHECYESSKYPYRKDRYPTIETHGYGERLTDNY